jgi:O-antigen/teichoic acid export membrane protein
VYGLARKRKQSVHGQPFKEKQDVSSTITAQSSLPAPAATNPPRLAAREGSLRWNFSWTFVGNVIYSACQWGMLVLLAKLGNPQMVGQYGLGMAIATPVLAFSSLQLRALLTTDVSERVHFGEYLGFRELTTFLALLVITGIAFRSGHAIPVIVAIGVAQAIEMVSDLYWGRLQFHDHMDRIAKSMIIRGVLGLGAMAAGVYWTHSVLWGALGLVFARASVLFAYDMSKRTQLLPRTISASTDPVQSLPTGNELLRPRWSPAVQTQLLRTSITLGVIAMLVSLLPNLPRYFIVGSQGEHALGIFTATAFLVSSGNLIVTALGQSAFVPLAKYYASGNLRRFKLLLAKLLGIGALLGLGGVAVSLLFGKMLLTLLYRPEYAEHTDLLVAMMIGGGLSYLSGLMGSAVTATRCFGQQIPLLVIAVGSTALASRLLIPSHGLLGAALAVIITSAVMCVGECILLWYVFRKAPALHDAVSSTNPPENWETKASI